MYFCFLFVGKCFIIEWNIFYMIDGCIIKVDCFVKMVIIFFIDRIGFIKIILIRNNGGIIIIIVWS